MRVLCLAVLLSLATAPAAVADDGWSVAPSGDGRPSVYAEGAPGTVLQDTVSVRNPTREPLKIRLSGGSWVAFAREGVVEVPARTRADVPFTVNVPPNASPGDDHSATITARAEGRTATVPVQLRVTGPALAALTVERVAVRGDRITYELVNRGTTTLTPTLAVRAEGLFGEVLDRAPRTLPVRLPPGSRVELSEPWADPPALDAVDVRLTVTAGGGAGDSGSAAARFVPWGAMAGAGGGMALVGGAFFLVRHRGRRKAAAAPDGARADEQPRTEIELTGAVT
ncbi:COG1470 family protein [Streptomyces sp. NPDC002845]